MAYKSKSFEKEIEDARKSFQNATYAINKSEQKFLERELRLAVLRLVMKYDTSQNTNNPIQKAEMLFNWVSVGKVK